MEKICIALIAFKGAYAVLSAFMSAISYSQMRQASIKTQPIWRLLTTLCIFEALSASSWVTNTLYKGGIFEGYPLIIVAAVAYRRLGWIVTCAEYLIFALFLEQLVKKIPHLKLYKIITWIPAIVLIFFISCITIFNATVIDMAQRDFEYVVYGYVHYYIFATLIFVPLYTWYINRYTNLPRVAKEQATTFTHYFILPHLCFIIFITNYNTITVLRSIAPEKYIWIMLNDVVTVAAILYTVRRLLHLRLLGFYQQIQRHKTCHFAQDLKYFLIDLSKITCIHELQTIIKKLFERAYKIRQDTVELYVRPLRYIPAERHQHERLPSSTLPAAEQFLTAPQHRHLIREIAKRGVLIRDEIEFDYFYEEDAISKELILLLNQTNADVFIPIYEHIHITGYITISRGARADTLFSNIERDEMLVYANHLSIVIHLLQNRSIKELMMHDKEAQEELYTKQQEINHYKESIRTILRNNNETTVGVAIYCHKKISWMSDSFQSLLELTTPVYSDTPYYTQLMQLCIHAIRYDTQRSLIITTDSGKQVKCTAIPRLEEKLVIVISHYVDLAENSMIPFAELKDIATWEYALYLQTTESGKLINQIIPGTTPEMFNLKIDLLKAAMNRKPLLLELSGDDLGPIAEMIHHISMRTKLHILSLATAEQSEEYALMLYGMEPTISSEHSNPLLLTLHNTGTLFIQHIERLSLTSQERLAEFITTGMFKPLLSDRQIRSNVRIICSTENNLVQMADDKQFSERLLKLLHPSRVSMPSLLNISRQDLENIARALTRQTIETTELKEMLALSRRDIDQIMHQRPTSFHELKHKVQNIIYTKSQHKRIDTLVAIGTQTRSDAPSEIMHIIRMGRRALHEKQTLLILWNHFQSQTKIAEALKVNRSSVHRRCKELNITNQA